MNLFRKKKAEYAAEVAQEKGKLDRSSAQRNTVKN